MRLAAEPGDEPSAVAASPADGRAVAAQRGGERRAWCGDIGEPLLHQLVDGGVERVGVVLGDLPGASTSSSSVKNHASTTGRSALGWCLVGVRGAR